MEFQCYLCLNELSSAFNLRRHYVRIHNLTIEEEKSRRITCNEADCGDSFHTISSLADHLERNHGFQMEREYHIFQNFDEFLTWKSATEKEDCCLFTSNRGKLKKLNGFDEEEIHKYFYCNRSGFFRPARERRRKIKSQGSCKINNYCTAMMHVTVCNGEVEVDYQKTHYNHELELRHIPIPKPDRDTMAMQISQGLSPDVILRNVHTTLSGSCERLRLVTRKDIHNIKHALQTDKN